jgi:hypothetical protein
MVGPMYSINLFFIFVYKTSKKKLQKYGSAGLYDGLSNNRRIIRPISFFLIKKGHYLNKKKQNKDNLFLLMKKITFLHIRSAGYI